MAVILGGAVEPRGSAQAPATTAAADGVVRPVAVWLPGPLEVIVAFDRPVEAALAGSLIGRKILYIESDAAGPAHSPPAVPSGALRIVEARLIDDARTLVLGTDPHPRVARYFLALPGGPAALSVPRPDEPALAYDLSGVELAWSSGDKPLDEPTWTGWWPCLDSDATGKLTRGSRPHETALALLSQAGRLGLSTLIRLPQGQVTLQLEATGSIEEAALGDVQVDEAIRDPQSGTHRAELTVESAGDPLYLAVTLRTGEDRRPFALRAFYRLAKEASPHPLQRERLMVPWAPVTTSAISTGLPLLVPELAGGDPDRGKALFTGERARCSQCHLFRGQGGKAGPDLTEIGRKGRAEIYRSIAAPSASIEPAYTSYTVATRDGRILAGIVQADPGDAIRVTDNNAHVTLVPRSQVRQVRPSATSIMPVGLAGALGDAAIRDLIAFLTAPQARAKTKAQEPAARAR